MSSAVRVGELAAYLGRQFGWKFTVVRGIALPSIHQKVVNNWCWLRSVTMAPAALVLNLKSTYTQTPDPILAPEFYALLSKSNSKLPVVIDIAGQFYCFTSYELHQSRTAPDPNKQNPQLKEYELFLAFAENSLQPLK